MFNTVSHLSTLDCWCEEKTSIPLDQVIKKVVTLFSRSGNKRTDPPKFTINTSKAKIVSPHDVIFQFIVYYYEGPEEAQSHTQCCWSGDGSASVQRGQKTKEISLYHQFKNTNLCQNYGHQQKVKDFTRSENCLFKFIWCKRYDLTINKLSIFCRLQMLLTMPNLSFHDQRELSTGLQLQQKVQNHIAISNCCPDA